MRLDLWLMAFTVFVSAYTFMLFQPSDSPLPSTPSFSGSASFDPRFFYPALNYAANSRTVLPDRPVIIIVPHHLLGAYITADLLAVSSRYKTKNIYLIGPNHLEKGSQKLLTPNSNSNRQIIDTDHSVGNILPFIHFYFPQASVFPYLVKHDADLADIQDWTGFLASKADSETLFVFSLDFSHYLPANTAAVKDLNTYSLITSENLLEILTLNNDYIDSPSGLALAVSLARKITSGKFIVAHHTNSGFLLSDFSVPTTSYFGLAFIK